MTSILLKPATRSEAEVRAAMDMRNRAAAICDELSDAMFEELAKKGNIGIGTLAQRHYMKCAAAIRALPLTREI